MQGMVARHMASLSLGDRGDPQSHRVGRSCRGPDVAAADFSAIQVRGFGPRLDSTPKPISGRTSGRLRLSLR